MERLSLQQRMHASKKRRQEQVSQYLTRERREHQKGDKHVDESLKSSKKKKGGRKEVKFDPKFLLFEAVTRNDLNEVRQLLSSGLCDKDADNYYGMTSMHQCCIDHNLSMIHVLAKEFSADISKSDNENWTPLHTVALFGFADIAKFLLDNGADPLALNMDLNMPYDMCENAETLDVIEAHMAVKEVTQDKIEIMRKVGERKILKELQHQVTSGRKSKYVGSNGESLLHVASANGYYEVASLLINKVKHDVSCFDNDLWQPIHAASYWQQVKVMELLLTNGADIYAKNNEGDNAINLCRDKDFSEWMVQTYNNHHKKSGKSNNNVMKSMAKKSESSTRHKFDSSVSLIDLNKYSLSSNRLNMERKEKKQKKDKENEYHCMISSKVDFEEDYEDDDDGIATELKYKHSNGHRHGQVRKASHQLSSPLSMAQNKPRRESESHAISEKRKNSGKDNARQDALADKNVLHVPSARHSDSPNVSERSFSFQAALKHMDEKSRRKGSAEKKDPSGRKNSEISLNSADKKYPEGRKNSENSTNSRDSDNLQPTKSDKNVKNRRIKIKNPQALSYEEKNPESNKSQEISKRSKSLVDINYNEKMNKVGKLHRMSIGQNNYKKPSQKRCIIS